MNGILNEAARPPLAPTQWPDVSDFVQKLVGTVWTSNDVNCPETLRDPQGVFGKMS